MVKHMTLFEFMNQHIQSLAADNSWCRFKFGHAMEEHTKLSQVQPSLRYVRKQTARRHAPSTAARGPAIGSRGRAPHPEPVSTAVHCAGLPRGFDSSNPSCAPGLLEYDSEPAGLGYLFNRRQVEAGRVGRLGRNTNVPSSGWGAARTLVFPPVIAPVGQAILIQHI